MLLADNFQKIQIERIANALDSIVWHLNYKEAKGLNRRMMNAGERLCIAADRVQAKADQTDVDVVALRAVMDDWDAITQTEEE